MQSTNEDWTCEIVSRLHRIRVTKVIFARRCGYTPQYMSMLLNGRKEFESDYAKKLTKKHLFRVLEELEHEYN